MTVPSPFFQLTTLGLPTTAATLLQQWLTAMQTAFPGYQPSSGNLEYVLAQIFSSMAADLATTCSSGADALFENFGTQLLNLPYQQGSAAAAIVQVTAINNNGYTLNSGTQVLLTLSGVQVAFATVGNTTIPNGQTTAQVGVIALNVGSINNGAGAPVQLNTQLQWVQSVTLVTAASGGADAESSDHYLNRLATELQLIAPRPITQTDYAQMASSFVPNPTLNQQEVGRATAIDGYDPLSPAGPNDSWDPQAGGTGTFGNEREVTVAIADANGNPLNQATALGVRQFFDARREINFIVNVVAPNYNIIYAKVTVVANSAFTAATVQANVQAQLLSYIQPANFGLAGNVSINQPWWNNTNYLYISHVTSAVQVAAGVDHVVAGSLAIDVNPVPTNTTDLLLAGPFPLPTSTVNTIPLSNITVLTS